MAIRGVSKGTASTADTSIEILSADLAPVAGELLLAFESTRSGTGQTFTPPDGTWTQVIRTDRTTTQAQVAYYRWATGSEPTSYLFGYSVASQGALSILAIPSIDQASPIVDFDGQSNASSTAVTAPSIDTDVANCVLVFCGAINAVMTYTADPAMTEQTDQSSVAGSAVSHETATEVFSGVGATGTRTATASAGGASVAQLIALRPASTPGSSAGIMTTNSGYWGAI